MAVIEAPPAEPADVPLVDDEDEATPARGIRGDIVAARAVRRIVRRPVRWAQRPWPTDRIVRFVVTALSLVITTVVMMNVVHFNPINLGADLIFDQTTPTGGDMGAHVWGPAFLRDHLLPNFQLSGWSMDWYAGMPVYQFYMVVPALAIVALDTVFAYGVAFKLVAISGLVSLPFCCWAFGRLARFRYPTAGALRLRRHALRPRRELQHLRRQPEVDDGRRVLVLHRPQPDDPRLRPARPRHADRALPQLGGHRAGPRRRVPRDRRHLHGGRGARHRPRQHRRMEALLVRPRRSASASSCCRRSGSGRSSPTTTT